MPNPSRVQLLHQLGDVQRQLQALEQDLRQGAGPAEDVPPGVAKTLAKLQEQLSERASERGPQTASAPQTRVTQQTAFAGPRPGQRPPVSAGEQSLRAIVNTCEDFLYLLSPDGRLEFCSPACREFFGHEPAHLLGRPIFDFVPAEETDQLRSCLAEASARTRAPAAFTHRFLTRGQHWLWLETRFRAVSADLLGGTPAVVGVSRRFGDAPAEPRDDTLDRQAHLARVTAVAEMAGGLAHELAQPLAAVSMYLQAALRQLPAGGADPTELRETLQRAGAQTQFASDVVRRYRRMLRRSTPERVPADVNELLREAVALCRPHLREHGVAVEWQLTQDLPPVTVDRVQIEQVLINLLRNAADAMGQTPQGQRLLNLSTTPARGEVWVSVRDSGPGLPPDMLDDLVRPFRTTKPHGLGLGLPLSDAIVRAHGGRLWANPNPDRGTTFSFALPLSGTATHGDKTLSLSDRR